MEKTTRAGTLGYVWMWRNLAWKRLWLVNYRLKKMEWFLQLKSNGERYFMKEIFYFPQEGDKDAKGELVKRDPSKPHQCTKCLRGFSSPFALKQVCSLTTRLQETRENFFLPPGFYRVWVPRLFFCFNFRPHHVKKMKICARKSCQKLCLHFWAATCA